jgi:hypothetical protein
MKELFLSICILGFVVGIKLSMVLLITLSSILFVVLIPMKSKNKTKKPKPNHPPSSE